MISLGIVVLGQSRYIRVKVNQANVRERPIVGSTITGKAKKGQEFEVFASKGPWQYIATNGVKGWIHNSTTVVIGTKSEITQSAAKRIPHTFTIKSSYNKFENQTVFYVDLGHGKNKFRGRLRIGFTFTGKRTRRPPQTVTLIHFNTERLFRSKMIVLYDGKRFSTNSKPCTVEKPDAAEEIVLKRSFVLACGFEIPYSRYLAIARSSSVEMQIGTDQIALTPEELSAMFELAGRRAYVEPPKRVSAGVIAEIPSRVSGGIAEIPSRVSGGIVNGNAISLPKPQYPDSARAVRASGMVKVAVIISKTGRLISATAISGHPLLRSAAVAAARRAKFRPTIQNGEAVEVAGELVYIFRP